MTTEREILHDTMRSWMSDAGGSLTVHALVQLLQNLEQRHGENFSLVGAIDALKQIAEDAAAMEEDLEKRRPDNN